MCFQAKWKQCYRTYLSKHSESHDDVHKMITGETENISNFNTAYSPKRYLFTKSHKNYSGMLNIFLKRIKNWILQKKCVDFITGILI